MLDRDLAALYEVETKTFNQSVKRNACRFPSDFMFQLTQDEWQSLRSQFVTSKNGRGGVRYLPYAFTEQGVAMLSSVLNSGIAIEINIRIMRAFVALRQIIAAQPEYELLKEKIRRIELEVRDIHSQPLVEDQRISGKVTQLSREVQVLRENVRYVSEVLDQFQDAHIVIKRPEEGV